MQGEHQGNPTEIYLATFTGGCPKVGRSYLWRCPWNVSGYGSNGHVSDRYSWLILWLLFGTGVSFCWILTHTRCLVGSLWSKCLSTRRCSPDFGTGINTWTGPIQSMRPTLKVYGPDAYHSWFMDMKGKGRVRYPSWFNPFRCWLGPKESKPPTSLGDSKSYWQPFDFKYPKPKNNYWDCFSSTHLFIPSLIWGTRCVQGFCRRWCLQTCTQGKEVRKHGNPWPSFFWRIWRIAFTMVLKNPALASSSSITCFD